MNIQRELQIRLSKVLADFCNEPQTFAAMVRPAGDTRFGDYQANCAMPLAKQQGTHPRDVALRIVDKLDLEDMCEPPEIAGPGFINLRLRDDWLLEQVNTISGDERLGVPRVGKPETIIIDYSGPNVAKPMHVGHLRSTVIGAALYRIFRFLGHHVIGDNHLGDWGTQFGMIIYGYKHFLNHEAYAAAPVTELARLYRVVHTLCDYHAARQELPKLQQIVAQKQQAVTATETALGSDKEAQKQLKKLQAELTSAQEDLSVAEGKLAAVRADEVLHAQADVHDQIIRLSREETALLHGGDPTNRQLWQQFLPQCLAALNRVYDRLGVQFDLTLGESYYDPHLADVVRELSDQGISRESDGAQCVFLPGHKAPFIIQKADGAFTYATTDLATIRDRVERLKADRILYVVDARQADHFQMLFAVAKEWGYSRTLFEHLKFGTVNGPDGKPYKTRSGDTVGLESLLDEAAAKAREIVARNDDAKVDADGRPAPELDEASRDRIAEIVSIGAIKYADLRHHRESDYVFDWDKMLAMTGDTAAYMQYAYARVQGIFRKSGLNEEQLWQNPEKFALSEPAERALMLRLCRWPEALEAAANEYRPNLLTQYLYELANDLTQFYSQCPVLKAENARTRDSRLRLVLLSGRVLQAGLDLLGIEVSERM